jgi:2,5-furandicarboxylate decarboxylase 1
VISGAQGSILDPSTTVQFAGRDAITPVAHLQGISAKMGLDATRPLQYAGHVFTRVRIPGEKSVDMNAAVNVDSAREVGALLGD